MKASRKRQFYLAKGASLATVLILLLAIMLIGTTTARLSLQGEKAARNERDFRVAFFAAEAALADAQADIDNNDDRESPFMPPHHEVFMRGCGTVENGVSHGLCATSATGSTPVWLSADLLDTHDLTARTVAYGQVTKKLFATGEGPQSAMLPRYLIELLTPDSGIPIVDGEAAHADYRITAVGFGMRESTHVVLQAVYRRERIPNENPESAEARPYEFRSRRLSWREIPHWQELRNAIKKK